MAALVVLGAGFWACSDDASVPIGSDADSGVTDGGSSDTGPTAMGIGPEGGTVVGDGVTIVIPPGALAASVMITVAANGTPPSGFTGLSRLYTFGPDGTAFLKPVSVTVTLDQTASNPVVYWSKPGGGYESLGGTTSANKVTAQITHFSSGFAGAGATDGGILEGGTDGGPVDGGSDGGLDSAVDAGPQPVTVTSRDTAGVLANMTWAAWQDGPAGAWVALSASSTGTYGFTPTASTYAVAVACADGTNANSNGSLVYRTASTVQVAVTASNPCAPVSQPPAYILSGTMTNLPASTVWVRTGGENGNGAGQVVITNNSAPYSNFNYVAGHSYDVGFAPSDTGDLNVLKMLLVRGLTFGADGGNTIRDIDWGVEGFAPGSNTATVTNATATTQLRSVYAMTGDGFGLPLGKGAPVVALPSLSQDFSTIPMGTQTANDRYGIVATDTNGQQINQIEHYVHDAANVSVALPATFAPGFDIMTGAPYSRPAYTIFAPYAGAQRYAFSWHYSPSKFVVHDFGIDVDAATLSGAGPFQFFFPDFSAVAGWNVAWAPPAVVTAGQVGVGGSASSTTTITGGFDRRTSSVGSSVP